MPKYSAKLHNFDRNTAFLVQVIAFTFCPRRSALREVCERSAASVCETYSEGWMWTSNNIIVGAYLTLNSIDNFLYTINEHEAAISYKARAHQN